MSDVEEVRCIYCDETDFDTRYDACEGCREIKGLDGDPEEVESLIEEVADRRDL